MSSFTRKPRVYCAGPITKGDLLGNVRAGIDAAEKLRKLGFDVFCPHLSAYYQVIYEVPYEEWLEYDFNWIRVCDAVYRMPGESAGADREEAFAKGASKPIFFSVEDLVRWRDNRGFYSWD